MGMNIIIYIIYYLFFYFSFILIKYFDDFFFFLISILYLLLQASNVLIWTIDGRGTDRISVVGHIIDIGISCRLSQLCIDVVAFLANDADAGGGGWHAIDGDAIDVIAIFEGRARADVGADGRAVDAVGLAARYGSDV